MKRKPTYTFKSDKCGTYEITIAVVDNKTESDLQSPHMSRLGLSSSVDGRFSLMKTGVRYFIL